jgi:hypothetical protein
VASDLDVVNRALSRLGAARVGQLSDDTKNARAARSALDVVRFEVLTDHPWNCATRRVSFYANEFSITAAAWVGASSRYRVTLGQHTLREGDPVTISGVDAPTELNGSFVVGAATSTTIDILDPATGLYVDGSAFAAWTSGGAALLNGLFDHSYQYELPDDCLRVLEIDGQSDTDWAVENGRLATDFTAPLKVRYIWRNEDTETYPPLLVSALAARLAQELALEIVDSPQKSAQAEEAYRRILSRAKLADGQEQTPATLDELSWVTARLTS